MQALPECQDWQSTLDGSLTATFLTLKCLLPGMSERGRGAILTMASGAARLPGLGAPAPYVAAKAGGWRSPARPAAWSTVTVRALSVSR
jgi:3-oxoacyl-[acyl-carrier protein] reductase